MSDVKDLHGITEELMKQLQLIRENARGRRMMAILIDDEGIVEVITPANYPVVTLMGALELAKLSFFED
jgi:acyl-CoA reductase-like NAD-dependent aldehyde dehydrogenase